MGLYKKNILVLGVFVSIGFIVTQLSCSSSEKKATSEDFRKAQPLGMEPRPLQLPPVKNFKLSNGIQVYLVEKHDLPTISLDLVFEGGSIYDKQGKEGKTDLCMDLMTEGTESFDKVAFAEQLADVASQISSFVGMDSQGMSMHTLKKHFDKTWELFIDTLLTPGLRQKDLQRLAKSKLESIKQSKGSAGSVAKRLSMGVLFGFQHPMGRLSTETTVKSINVNDCKQHQADFLKPEGTKLFVVGDLTESEIITAFQNAKLKSWSGKPVTLPEITSKNSLKGRIFFVDIPGSQQSAIYLQDFGPQRNSENFFSNLLMSEILGGGFTSRINMNLREDKGYSYGAGGGFFYTPKYGLFKAASTVRPDSTYQSVKEMLKEIENLRSGVMPVTDEEILREKNGETLGLPGQFATSRQAIEMYRDLVRFNMPLDFYNNYIQKITAVNKDGVMNAAKNELHPDDIKIFVVGDGKSPLIEHRDGKNVELKKNGKQLNLYEGLKTLATKKGELVELNTEGKIVKVN